MGTDTGAPDSTRGADYTGRLLRLERARWKRVLNAQAPYRWHIRRLLGAHETLDVGCGIGRNLEHLAPHGVGVDHNEHSVEVCRARGLRAFTPAQFATSGYAKPGRFSAMLVAHVIEHMTRGQAIGLLSEYLGYLAPRARVVLICPQERGYASDPTHIRFTDFDGLTEICDAVGLSVSRQGSFPFARAAGKVFAHNQFVVVAARAGARTRATSLTAPGSHRAG
ncbi:MAG TPA: class I SAM-dependent methyltransferase [Solirubrobacteraceae bacterium]|nr:class I SAM-dependent methyltransferase [Solirubrobacteraceae bacterium]